MSARSLAASSAPSPAPPPQPEPAALAAAAGPEDAAGAVAPPLLPLMASAAAAPASGPAPLAPRTQLPAPGLAAPSTQLPAPGARTHSPGAAGGGGSARGARPHRRGHRPGVARLARCGRAEPRPRRGRPRRGQRRGHARAGAGAGGAPRSRAPAAAASLHLAFQWGRKEGEGEITAEGAPVKGKREQGKERKEKEGFRQFPESFVRGRSVGSAGGRGLLWAGPWRGGAAPGSPEGGMEWLLERGAGYVSSSRAAPSLGGAGTSVTDLGWPSRPGTAPPARTLTPTPTRQAILALERFHYYLCHPRGRVTRARGWCVPRRLSADTGL